jgi:hypothetical protein
MKKTISEVALFTRLSRKLKKEGLSLHRCSVSSQWSSSLGRYYTVDVNRNTIESSHIDLEEWAKNEGVIKSWETLEAE